MKTSDIIKKLKNPTKPMLCLMVGFIFFFFGFMMIITKPKTEYSSNTTIVSAKLSDEEAKNLMESLLRNALNIYEKPSELFNTSDAYYKEPVKEEEEKETTKEEKKEEKKEEAKEETKEEEQKEETKEENNAILISNYEEIIKTIFTDNAIKQLENMEFNGNKYVVKDSDKVYFLKEIIKKNNFFLNDSYSFGTPVINENKIKCNISFNRVVIDKNDDVNYELFIKELVLVKKDDKWLIDSFNYTNG